MVDVVSPEIRSRMMAKIRGEDTAPEILLRRMLHASGFRFRLHRKDLPGSPDIVLRRHGLVIFVHGCFWHRHEACWYARIPSTRQNFWSAKLDANASRDRAAIDALQSAGWRVLVVWECALRDRTVREALPLALSDWIRSSERNGVITGTRKA